MQGVRGHRGILDLKLKVAMLVVTISKNTNSSIIN